MTNKARNRAFIGVLVGLTVLVCILVIPQLINEQKAQQQQSEEEQRHKEFFAWRDK